jgi:hypothetical protein
MKSNKDREDEFSQKRKLFRVREKDVDRLFRAS